MMRNGIGWATLAAVTVAGVGCYNPDIKNGGLQCAAQAPKCPSGYVCSATGFCWKTDGGGTGGGIGGGAGGGGGSGGGIAGGSGSDAKDVGVDLPSERQSDVAACSLCPPVVGVGDVCDPVCQGTGCSCDQACTVKSGKTVCAAAGARKAYESCTPTGSDCDRGLVCLGDACGGRCYRHCRTDSDCPARAKCSFGIYYQQTYTGFDICDVPANDCNPLLGLDTCGAGLGCYVLGIDTTGCDCKGTLTIGASCVDDRECSPGSLCIAATSGGSACRKICNLKVPGNLCPSGQSCKVMVSGAATSTTWGFCSA